MLFHKYRGCLLGVAAACLLALGASSRGGSEEGAKAMKAWRDAGRRLLFRLGTGRGHSAEWLHRELAAVDPNSTSAINAAESVVAGATDAYGRDAIVLQGRLPLDINPRCILGLYAAERFPGARLGDWGRRQLRLCIEQACLIVRPEGGDWHAWLETGLLDAQGTPGGVFQEGSFTTVEAPYLFYYLAENARSVDARHKARERLAGCLWQGYGLEPGLRQYVLLHEQGYRTKDACLDGVAKLDRVGPRPAVKKLYEQRLADANSLEQARDACQRLVNILLGECRYRQAGAVLDLVYQRFAQVQWTAPEVKEFLQEFRANAIQTRQRLVMELTKATRESQALQCCRRLDALWAPQEAPGQWRILIEDLERGTPAQQCARVFLARALLRVGQTDAAEPLVGELAPSGSPFARAQSLALSAEIAHARGQWKEAAALYAQALQIDRPTPLPDWCKSLVIGLSPDAEASVEELQAQRLLFQGCHDLIDADYAAVMDNLYAAATDFRLLPDALRRVLPCAMMMACLGVEDYVEAETWGYRALAEYQRDCPDDSYVPRVLTTIQDLDLAMSQFVTAVRREASDAAVASALSEQAAHVCDAHASLGMCMPLMEATGKGLQQCYIEVRKRRDAQALTEEYRYLSRQATRGGKAESAAGPEMLLFAAQVLGGESLEQIRKNFAAVAEEPEDRDRMQRFAGFALQANRPDLMRSAMDLAASEPKATADLAEVQPTPRKDIELREDLAGTHRVDAATTWRDLGRLLLSRSGTARGPMTEWFDRQLDVADPNSDEAVRSAESLLMRILDGYGQNAMAVAGRIPLDAHPQCILGLYAAERFPGTKIGQWGRRWFERCVEQACSVAMSAADANWHERLEAQLLAEGKTPDRSQSGGFSWTERPYLYLYLGWTARSVDVRHKAAQRLADHLWEEFGLEAGLRRRLVLLGEGDPVDGAWLDVAAWLERIGFRREAREVYGQLIRNADTAEQGRQAAEGLARILIAESKRREARSVLVALSERFPNVEWAAPDIKDFVGELQSNREETSRKLAGELARTTKELRLLHLCRLFDALWTVEEAPQRWQAFVHSAEAGSLAEQFGRVFMAKALLGAGKADASQAMVRNLAESVNPFLQAQSIALLAEIARLKGDMVESSRLYLKAAGTDRPTPLPGWFRGLVQVPPLDARTPASQLQAWTRLLKACNNLTDGDFAAAEEDLASMAADSRSLPEPLQHVLPCAMALAYWGTGDYAEAETWGYLALEECRRDDPNDGGSPDLLAKIQEMDMTVCRLAAGPWEGAADAPADPTVREQAICLCEIGASLDSSVSRGESAGDGMRQLYVQAKKRQMARSLAGEYRWIRQRRIATGKTEYAPDPEPLLFAAQVLGGDSFDRIRENFASVPGDEGIRDRMYRFIAFAREANRPDLARSAMDVVAADQTYTANAEVLEDIAQMYLEAASHQKAIDVYQKMAGAASTSPDKAKSARLKIIEIYAENMKNPGKAVQECEEFIRKYPDDPQAGEVEFLMGKLAYLNKDYAGAVGQLDGFRKRHPQHSEMGQAMLLAGLSRMAEGNTRDAIGRFTEVIRTYPDDDLAARSKFLIGYALVSEQQYSEALEVFKQLVEQFPQSQYVPQARSMIDRLSKVSR